MVSSVPAHGINGPGLASVARLAAVVALLRPFAAPCSKRAKNALSAREAAYLYRGVHAGHPAMAAALHGLVVPGRLNGACYRRRAQPWWTRSGQPLHIVDTPI